MPQESHPLDGPEISFYSFWRPESVSKNCKDLRFQSLGQVGEITEKLLRLPRTKPIFCPIIPSVRFLWKVDRGVILQVRAEQSADMLGEVLMLGAVSAVPDKVLFKLYVQLYEQFGTTMLDETSGDFLSVKAFRARCSQADQAGPSAEEENEPELP